MRHSAPVHNNFRVKRVGFMLGEEHKATVENRNNSNSLYKKVDVVHPSSLRKSNNPIEETKPSSMKQQSTFQESQLADCDPPYHNYVHRQEPSELTAYME